MIHHLINSWWRFVGCISRAQSSHSTTSQRSGDCGLILQKLFKYAVLVHKIVSLVESCGNQL